MMQIPSDIYGYKLFDWAHHVPVENEMENAVKSVLCRLLYRNTLLLSEQDFSDEEKQIIQSQGWCDSANIEIAARANDVLRKGEKDKRAISKRTSDLYLQLFDKTNDYHCLLLAILVRNIKVICDDAFFDNVAQRLSDVPPYWLSECVKALKKSYPEQVSSLGAFLEQQYQNLYKTNDFRHVRDIVEALLVVNAITLDEADYRRAISFESEADYEEANKGENTFLMQTHINYEDAYRMIYRVRNIYPKDEQRIKQKRQVANRTFAYMLNHGAGIQTQYEVPEELQRLVKADCELMEVSDIWGAVLKLISLPYITEAQVETYKKQYRARDPLFAIAGVESKDAQGDTIGVGSANEGMRVNAHKYYRLSINYAIRKYLNAIIERRIDCSFDSISTLLQSRRPTFVGDEIVLLYTKGLSFIFDGDVLSASYILMPTLESFLRRWMESIYGKQRHYERERNDDYNLSAIMDMLKDQFDNPEEWYEVWSFMSNGLDENFRNRLLHGLMHPEEIFEHGTYLFWICLKLYFNEWCRLKTYASAA